MKDDKETNQIIRTVKELFMKNIKNNRELSNLIDKYLIPQDLEKKNNAEVSTPYKLRQEMLDKIPIEFWSDVSYKVNTMTNEWLPLYPKVFEPCAGKGGFIIDIIDRFMNGLEKTIPDEKERYKTIVEECLYFSDINSTNIFICKLLIDPYNEYKLNYNEGNTLELDIKEKWDIDGFDAVIGNPPYQNKKICTQRIRKSHIKNGDIKENYDETYKYKIIDKINKSHTLPGVYYYNNYKMLDYGKPKIIMCSGGYLMPSLDKDGVYNISDNMLYMLINDLSEYEGLTILINSQLIKYLNKITMTDNIHGRDLVIKNIKNISLSNIKCENDIYSQLNITKDELELIKKTINN
jgi:hypothetical protein